jgi:hypothetical protein
MINHPTSQTNSLPRNPADGATDESAQKLQQAIAARAYQNYLAGGQKDGHDEENWLKAEAEILAEQQSPGTIRDSENVKIEPDAELGDCLSVG